MPSSSRFRLSRQLLNPRCYPHPVKAIQAIETHISWLFLTGLYAYKLKKPVDLGFAKFTTLAERKFYCEEELRLNPRLAPGLYLDVVPIRGGSRGPRIGGKGRVIDYAVKMRQFPQRALASRALALRDFGRAEIDTLAATIAAFHEAASFAPPGGEFGTPGAVLDIAQENFDQMASLVRSKPDSRSLAFLRQWTEREHARLRDAMERRKSAGCIRECHGDLHLGNIVMLDGRPVPFDSIDFNPALRYIDVISEVAFLVMDLIDRKRSDLAWRFLNRYLEVTGDYGGISVLRFYSIWCTGHW